MSLRGSHEKRTPTSLRWRLCAWHFATMAAAAAIVTGYYHVNVSDFSRKEADDRLLALSHHVAEAAVLGTLAQSDELLGVVLEGALGHPDVILAAVFSPQGGLLAARTRDGRPAPHWPPPGERTCAPCTLHDGTLRWITPVVRAGRSLAPTTADAPSEAEFYGGPPPTRPSDPAGYLILDVTTQRFTESQRRLAVRALLILLFVLAVGLVVTFVITRRLIAPLRALANATREIGKGRWDAHLPRGSYGEIGQLADDFRHMVEELAKLDAENARHRETLAVRVAERTRELEDAYQNMKEMAEAKDQFVATVSHDFRSPLAIIQSALQTIDRDPDMPVDVRRRFLQRAERQCKRLSAMVHDLLDLARIEGRDATLEQTLIPELVAEGIEAQRPAFEEKGVALDFKRPFAPITAEVDPHYLARAIANLLDNALKFTPAGGKVTVQLLTRDGWIYLYVHDTGPGIPESEQARVFERFYQGEHASASGRGSGLGLAIVAGVARRHHGHARVKSRPGEGATFELALPLSQTALPTTPPDPAPDNRN